MEYYSTRNLRLRASPARAIVDGIAPDGGLYLPDHFPAFPMEKLAGMEEQAISSLLLSLFFDDFSPEESERMVRKAYENRFETGEIAPLRPVGDAYCLELWHGPTAAFKDVALSLLPRLLTAAAQKCGVSEEICVLTATSGDTGSAALAGFAKTEGCRILVFYPEGGVSPIQERQMLALQNPRAAVVSVRGNFDDAQTGVKALFRGMEPPAGLVFSSANSINIGRLVPQIAYYFKAYSSLLGNGNIAPGDPVNFVVPSGNFGNLLAGYFAKRMGLPVGRMVVASNRNHILTDFFTTGLYDRERPFYVTSSPSMDILISSNLERLLSLTAGTEKTAAMMEKLFSKGSFRLSSDLLAALREDFSAYWADEEETEKSIRTLFTKERYLVDPHTAVAFCAYEKWRADEKNMLFADAPTVILSTASPYKFPRRVLLALDAAEDRSVRKTRDRMIGREAAEEGTINDAASKKMRPEEADAMERWRELDDLRLMPLLEKISGAPIPAALAVLSSTPLYNKIVCEKSEMAALTEKLLQKPGEYGEKKEIEIKRVPEGQRAKEKRAGRQQAEVKTEKEKAAGRFRRKKI